MVIISNLATEVAAGIIIFLLSALCVFLYKLPPTLKALNDFMRNTLKLMTEFERRMDVFDARVDVHDNLWSAHLKSVVRSEMIAEGKMDYPRIPPILQNQKDHHEN